MDKFINLTSALFEDEIDDAQREKIIEEIRNCEIEKELLPYLFHHRLICHFYALIASKNMMLFLNKESWRIINRYVVYEQLKSKEYFQEIKILCNELNEMNVKYALIKGGHLCSFLYERQDGLIQRSFNDIDILVDRKDIKCIGSLLESHGYFKGEYSPELNELREYSRIEAVQFLMTSHQSAPYIKNSKFGSLCKGDILIVDVNFSIFEGGKRIDPISTRELLGHTIKRRTLYGDIYYSLSPEHDLLQLLFHIYKDTKYELKRENNEQLLIYGLIDIYRYIKKNGKYIKWDYFYEIVKAVKVEMEICWILKYIKNWISDEYIDALTKRLEYCNV